MGQINVKIKKCNLMLRLRWWWFKKRRYILWNIPSATSPHRFRNVHQIQSPTLDTGKATALWKKFQKMKHNFSKISELFCHLFILVWWFWHGFSQFWLRHLKEQSKRKRKVTRKFGALAPYRHKSFCYWYYRERLKNFIFHLLLLFQWFCSLKQSIGTSEWILCNSHGEKTFKILQNQGN